MSDKPRDEAERLAMAFLKEIKRHRRQYGVYWTENDAAHGVKYGFRAGERSEKVMRLVEAARDWLAFEEACIVKDGPYCDPSIPSHMKRISEALADFNVNPEEK